MKEGTEIQTETLPKIPLDRPIWSVVVFDPKFARYLSKLGISCRVAEGRALGRHGNRIGIINPDRQVPTLAR